MSSSPLHAEPAMVRTTHLRTPAKLLELELHGTIAIQATTDPAEFALN